MSERARYDPINRTYLIMATGAVLLEAHAIYGLVLTLLSGQYSTGLGSPLSQGQVSGGSGNGQAESRKPSERVDPTGPLLSFCSECIIGGSRLIPMLNRTLTVPAFCGMAAPLVMVSLWALASLLRPGYDQLTQRGSELGTGPNSVVMNANFAVTGLFRWAWFYLRLLGLER
jgi:hypothetical protein